MNLGFNQGAHRDKALLKALNASLAIIEFDPKGKILGANENFCSAIGYAVDEIAGKHHSMFVDPAYARSPAYQEFWAQLGRGQFDAGEYERIGKGGREIWLQASYNPVLDVRGHVDRVVKVAADITATKVRNAEYEAKLKAVSLVQAIIEFTPAGEILDANPNFTATMGYAVEEIKGRHHRMFVEPDYAASSEYRAFWEKLGRGEFVADLFLRIAKGGRRVQLQASYNPIFDLKGRVVKVVKFATDVSDLLALSDALARLADNDLEHGIAQEFKPMFAGVRRDFNAAQQKLKAAMLGVAASVESVTSGSKEIAVASENLSGRSEQQAASLEETAAALTTVTDTIKATAHGSQEANRVVTNARTSAVAGGEVVGKAVEAMDRIEKSSAQISQIIGVIDEIAFQTNLLALNAGVEAARAGEAGRGFAVVASEVRALAQRSAEAAKEIKGLINASSEQVGEGVDLVRQTGQGLNDIIGQIATIATQIDQIARGAQEQATALNQVNEAVRQMDQHTQQNAAMAEEASAAGQSMREEANRLGALVGQFRLGQAASADPLRTDLQRAAPHAFAKRPAEPHTAPVRLKKAVGQKESWAEF